MSGRNFRLTATAIADDDIAESRLGNPIAAEVNKRLRQCTQASTNPKASP